MPSYQPREFERRLVAQSTMRTNAIVIIPPGDRSTLPKNDVKSDVARARRRRQTAADGKRNSRIPRVCEEYGCLSTPTGHPTPPSIAWHPLANTANGDYRCAQCTSMHCTCSDPQRVAEPFAEPLPTLSLRRGSRLAVQGRITKTNQMIFIY